MGRPLLGGARIERLACPAWIVEQLETLQAANGLGRAETVRDVLRAGLCALYEAKVRAPGFDPENAMVEARERGEPV